MKYDWLHGTLATLAILFPACIAQAAPKAVPDLQALFPDAATPLHIERTTSLTLGTDGLLTLSSVRFEPARSGPTWCGVVLSAPSRPPQAVVTIGVESTEHLACDGLSQAGLMPDDGPVRRIGLIYRTHAGKVAGVRPIVLTRDPRSQRWTLDDLVSGGLAELPGKPSLGMMRQALAHH